MLIYFNWHYYFYSTASQSERNKCFAKNNKSILVFFLFHSNQISNLNIFIQLLCLIFQFYLSLFLCCSSSYVVLSVGFTKHFARKKKQKKRCTENRNNIFEQAAKRSYNYCWIFEWMAHSWRTWLMHTCQQMKEFFPFKQIFLCRGSDTSWFWHIIYYPKKNRSE